MVIGISIFEVHIPGSQSLKHKRRLVKGLIDRVFHRFRVSIAESDYHDRHQRAEITVAVVSRDDNEARRVLDRIRELVEQQGEWQLTSWDPQYLSSR
jgi:uncharacterized protein YlxP (DUF503 family)